MDDQADLMSEQSQRAHIVGCFRVLFNDPNLPVAVDWGSDETILVSLGSDHSWFLMTIGSDDDRYRFELWYNCCDTGIYLEFAFPGETL